MHTSQKGHTRALGGTVAALGLLGLVAASSAGCDDDDTTGFTNGGSGGTAGRGGGGGRGGTSAGTGGSSLGGVGGSTGGSAGTGGSTSGSGGGGTGGSSAGSGGSDVGDAGPDATTGDGGPEPLTDQQMAEAICASYDALADCDAEPDCISAFQGNFVTLRANTPQCVDSINAYFGCMSGEPIESFTCDGDTATFAADTVNCDEEYCDFINCQVGDIVCP
jgi:hypothetical protein